MSRVRTLVVVGLLLSTVFLLCVSLQAQQYPQTAAQRQAFLEKLSDAAIERTHHPVRYDPAYVRFPHPDGDVPSGTGVCADEVIRSYRALGIDLQKEVHEDMQAHFSAYPCHAAATGGRLGQGRPGATRTLADYNYAGNLHDAGSGAV